MSSILESQWKTASKNYVSRYFCRNIPYSVPTRAGSPSDSLARKVAICGYMPPILRPASLAHYCRRHLWKFTLLMLVSKLYLSSRFIPLFFPTSTPRPWHNIFNIREQTTKGCHHFSKEAVVIIRCLPSLRIQFLCTVCTASCKM